MLRIGSLGDLGDALRQKARDFALRRGGDRVRQRLESLRLQTNPYGQDPFGMDLDTVAAALGPMLWLYEEYFRVQVRGVENVPAGRCLLVSNHSGQLPMDGAMIAVAVFLHADPPRVVRSMVERWVPTLPYVSTFFSRLGQVVGTPENCIRLLEADETILVFPEGTRGLNKVYAKRYQLASFGQGFMRLALATGSPIVPISVIGAEEQAPALVNVEPLAKLLGIPAVPITPTLLPIPLPSRYYITFGEPMRFEGSANEEDNAIEQKVQKVRQTIQSMVNEGLEERKSIFF
ncbi:MAG TPA: lysophospholipid acyltransferase family protein [Fredinandcohnia sp.]|nr:lysophospholipid acyltransferase family protein [Fredinandcohnia sp.]